MIIDDIEARHTFLITLDWVLALNRRYANSLEFSLVRISYGDTHELGETYGAVEAREQLTAMTLTLQKAFRETDIVTRDGANFWVLVPYTAYSEHLFDKIIATIQEDHHNSLNVVDRKISIFSFPIRLNESEELPTTALSLISYLNANNQRHVSHEFELLAKNIMKASPQFIL